jgi:hypothetical protein
MSKEAFSCLHLFALVFGTPILNLQLQTIIRTQPFARTNSLNRILLA